MRKAAVEKDFPFEEIDLIAELESYRKEIYRPNYHIHKWWANRLGSVFRAILLGLSVEKPEQIMKSFYGGIAKRKLTVLDPFMGSGTTLGEGLKLGFNVVGSDINPVSYFTVKQSLTKVDISELKNEYLKIESDIKDKIFDYYHTIDPMTQKKIPVLYYFWVKIIKSPEGDLPLFKSYVFSKNAYPKKKPEAKILCNSCGNIIIDRYDAISTTCNDCGNTFNPQIGNAKGQYVTAPSGTKYKIKELVNKMSTPPAHRLYAMLVLDAKGEKKYLPIKQYDKNLVKKVNSLLKRSNLPGPDMKIKPGHNTNQAMGYNYTNWKDFFNNRQLYCLGILLQRILSIKNTNVREHFLALFSGTLEFNNLFCSFKGEGTGAVRHMFAHHILKPEKMPLENNVWGTEKSSGSFSSLFKSRLIKAKQYLEEPFEIKMENNSSSKVFIDTKIDSVLASQFKEIEQRNANTLLLNTDSSKLSLPDESIDAVVTDPPYFDFVHYSELSDFFFSWLRIGLKEQYDGFKLSTCRQSGEVQDKCPSKFSESLGRVFKESHRVLKKDGLLIFSFHHSKPEGWTAIYNAISSSGLSLMAAYPVKAEMSVGSPKSAAKEPINIDSMLVCKKENKIKFDWIKFDIVKSFKGYKKRFQNANRTLTAGDLKVLMFSQILVWCSLNKVEPENVFEMLSTAEKELNNNNKESFDSIDLTI